MKHAMTTASSVLATLLLCAAGAQAQSPTAAQVSAQASAQASAASDPTSEQIASWIGGRHGEVDDDAATGPGRRLRDGQVHGEVGASIGSGGYKSAYGIATTPIGENSDLTVGLTSEHLGDGNRNRVRGYGGGYGGDRRSLFVGLNLNGADHSDGCDVLAPRPWRGALEPLSRAAPDERCGPAAAPLAPAR